MSLPDYTKEEQFYSYLQGITRAMTERAENLARAKSYVEQVQSDLYVDLYSELSAETKAELDAIEEL